jgi:hypothetical protein
MRSACQLLFKRSLLSTAFIAGRQNTSAQQIKSFSGANSQETFFKTNDGISIYSSTGVTFPFLFHKINSTIPVLHIVQNQNLIN